MIAGLEKAAEPVSFSNWMLQRHRPLRGANKRLIGHRSPQAFKALFFAPQLSYQLLGAAAATVSFSPPQPLESREATENMSLCSGWKAVLTRVEVFLTPGPRGTHVHCVVIWGQAAALMSFESKHKCSHKLYWKARI